MNLGIVLPILLPLFTALTLLLWTRPSAARRSFAALSLLTLLLVLLADYFLDVREKPWVMHAGGWPAPYGIALVLDLLSLLFLFFSAITVFASVLFAFAHEPVSQEHPLRYPLLFLLLFGVNMTFLTGDFFNLFVAFEVMLLASFALMTLECSSDSMRYALPYVLMNVVGSLFFLTMSGVVYGYFGTLNFAHLSKIAADPSHQFFVQIFALLAICVFGLKAAIFPFYFWLPRSYPVLPSPIAAIYGGILSKVGIYVLLRLFGTVFPLGMAFPLEVLLFLSGFTMLLGVLGAIAQDSIKKILSYHVISQMGFMILAIGYGNVAALTAALVYTLHNIVIKSSLFLIGGAGQAVYGTDELKKMGHLWGMTPLLGIFFLLQAFSLAGIPPLSGFWAKYLVIMEGLEAKQYLLVGVALLTGWMTLYSMLKIWNGAFWGHEQKAKQYPLPYPSGMAASISILVLFSLLLGFGAEGFIQVASRATEQLVNRREYQEAVLSRNM